MNLVIGTVSKLDTGALEVSALGQVITQSRLWVASHLLAGYDPGLEGTLEGSGTVTDNGKAVLVDVTVATGELVAAESRLAVGDRVVLVTEDNQVYYLLDKVVRYG